MVMKLSYYIYGASVNGALDAAVTRWPEEKS
jgi:hypothetical protein